MSDLTLYCILYSIKYNKRLTFSHPISLAADWPGLNEPTYLPEAPSISKKGAAEQDGIFIAKGVFKGLYRDTKELCDKVATRAKSTYLGPRDLNIEGIYGIFEDVQRYAMMSGCQFGMDTQGHLDKGPAEDGKFIRQAEQEPLPNNGSTMKLEPR